VKRGVARDGVLVCRKWMVGRVEVKLRLKIIMGTSAGTKIAFCSMIIIGC
jgi:hypothetical protein